MKKRLINHFGLWLMLLILFILTSCVGKITMLSEKELHSTIVDSDIYSRFVTIKSVGGQIRCVYSDDRTQSIKHAVIETTDDLFTTKFIDKIDEELRAQSAMGSHFYCISGNEEMILYSNRENGESMGFKIQRKSFAEERWHVLPWETGSENFAMVECGDLELVVYYDSLFKVVTPEGNAFREIEMAYDETHDVNSMQAVYSDLFHTIYCFFIDSDQNLWQLSLKLSNRNDGLLRIIQATSEKIASSSRLFSVALTGTYPMVLYYDDSNSSLKYRYASVDGVDEDSVGYFAEIDALRVIIRDNHPLFLIVSKQYSAQQISNNRFLISVAGPVDTGKEGSISKFYERGIMVSETPFITIDGIIENDMFNILVGGNELILIRFPVDLLPGSGEQPLDTTGDINPQFSPKVLL